MNEKKLPERNLKAQNERNIENYVKKIANFVFADGIYNRNKLLGCSRKKKSTKFVYSFNICVIFSLAFCRFFLCFPFSNFLFILSSMSNGKYIRMQNWGVAKPNNVMKL